MQWPITEEGNCYHHAHTDGLISMVSTWSGIINEQLGYIAQPALACGDADAAVVLRVIWGHHDLDWASVDAPPIYNVHMKTERVLE